MLCHMCYEGVRGRICLPPCSKNRQHCRSLLDSVTMIIYCTMMNKMLTVACWCSAMGMWLVSTLWNYTWLRLAGHVCCCFSYVFGPIFESQIVSDLIPDRLDQRCRRTCAHSQALLSVQVEPRRPTRLRLLLNYKWLCLQKNQFHCRSHENSH